MPDTDDPVTGADRRLFVIIGLIVLFAFLGVARLFYASAERVASSAHELVEIGFPAQPATNVPRLVSISVMKQPFEHNQANYISFEDITRYLHGPYWVAKKDSLVNCAAIQHLNPGAPPPESCTKYFEAEPKVKVNNPAWVLDAAGRHTFSIAASHPGGVTIDRMELIDVRSGQIVQQVSLPQVMVRYENCRSYFGRGCDFTQSLTVNLTSETLTGVYRIRFLGRSENGETVDRGEARFFIRAAGNQGRPADAVVIIPDWTAHAYNRHGGGSLYGVNDTELNFAPLSSVDKFGRISLNRPDIRSKLHSPRIYQQTIAMLQNAGLNVEVCGMLHVEREACGLAPSAPVVLIGHNEYVSVNIWRQLYEFVRSGGVLINFSGNLAWWKTRYEDGELFVFKGKHRERPIDGLWRETGLFVHRLGPRSDEIPPYPPSRLVGVSYRTTGYPVNRVQRELNRDSPLVSGLMLCMHPIFSDISARPGDRFLEEFGAVSGGVEIDGVPINDDGSITADHYIPAGARIRVMASSYAQRSRNKAPLKIGYVTEYQPEGNEGGRVFSLGSAGAVFQMGKSDSELSRLLRATIRHASVLADDGASGAEELPGCPWQAVR